MNIYEHIRTHAISSDSLESDANALSLSIKALSWDSWLSGLPSQGSQSLDGSVVVRSDNARTVYMCAKDGSSQTVFFVLCVLFLFCLFCSVIHLCSFCQDF